MSRLNILAVEDELIHQLNIRALAEAIGVNISAMASNAEEAISSFREFRPDIVLMDIRLNGTKTGIELAEELNIIEPVPIIFLTSSQEEELFDEAKSLMPYAYLTKPLTKEMLKHSIELAVQHFSGTGKPSNTASTPPTVQHVEEEKPKSFFIKIGNKLKRVDVSEIQFIEVEEKYCSIYTENKQIHVKIALKDFLRKLPAGKFIRVHRSFIVNSDYISTVKLNENLVVLGEKEVPFSRTYKEQLLNNINLI